MEPEDVCCLMGASIFKFIVHVVVIVFMFSFLLPEKIEFMV